MKSSFGFASSFAKMKEQMNRSMDAAKEAAKSMAEKLEAGAVSTTHAMLLVSHAWRLIEVRHRSAESSDALLVVSTGRTRRASGEGGGC
eukprot:scaffold1194_cov369-Prasinococcus_capsulatus_cf.AAC.8